MDTRGLGGRKSCTGVHGQSNLHLTNAFSKLYRTLIKLHTSDAYKYYRFMPLLPPHPKPFELLQILRPTIAEAGWVPTRAHSWLRQGSLVYYCRRPGSETCSCGLHDSGERRGRKPVATDCMTRGVGRTQIEI